jgi:capsule polysaccharide modification protein KpsS
MLGLGRLVMIQARIVLLKRMADKIWETDESAHIIKNISLMRPEENELKTDGMMVGKQHVRDYGRFIDWKHSRKKNINSAKDLNRVSYIESHDEERSDKSVLRKSQRLIQLPMS